MLNHNRPQRSLRILLGLIVGLLAANLLCQVQSFTPRQAQAAGIPDSGAQLQSVIDELQSIGKKMDKLQGLMESGKMKVVVESTEPKDQK